MDVIVRLMTTEEIDLVINYFVTATPEHLELLGVDPTRLPSVDAWRKRFEHELQLPFEKRSTVVIAWLVNDRAIGFSSADKIVYGDRANMHLHVIDADQRNRGIGAKCVKASVDLLFDTLRLKRLYCEPNAFNVAPNRTLQKAGFKYLKTHMTVPGPLNFHQAVTRWVAER